MKTTTFLKLLFLLVCSLLQFESYAQKEANNWYFGYNAGLNFSTSPPTVLYDGQTNYLRGAGTISDANGNLLFYIGDTQGIRDRRHQIMPNGSGTLLSYTYTIVTPWPNQPNKYFVFTFGSSTLHYSVIDMNLNNGFGDVTSLKDVVLANNTARMATAIQHRNARDFWIIVPQIGTNQYRAFLVSPSGISSIPVTSSAGIINTVSGGDYVDFKTAPDGKTLGVVTRIFPLQQTTGLPNKGLQLLNFDINTGLITNKGLIPDSSASSIEFSPDGTKLYCYRATYNFYYRHKKTELVQYDLTAGNVSNIFNGAVRIRSITNPLPVNAEAGHMQVALDGKIYFIENYGSRYLSVINRPSAQGLSCNFGYQTIDLGPVSTTPPPQIGKSGLYFPSFIQTYFYKPKIDLIKACFGDSAIFDLSNRAYVDSVRWNFGDPASGSAANISTSFNPKHYYTNPGTYTVQAIVHFTYDTDTLTQTIFVPYPLVKPNLGTDTTLCEGKSLKLNAYQRGATYIWSDSTVSDSILTVTKTGTYWVTVNNGCVNFSDTIQVNFVAPTIQPWLGPDTILCADTTFVLNGTVPNAFRYLWNDGSTMPEIKIKISGLYWLDAITPCGTIRDSVQVTLRDCTVKLNIPNIVTPNSDNFNDRFEPKGLETGEYELSIYNRWGTRIYQQQNYTNQWPEEKISAGTYYYLLRNKQTGKTYKGWVEVVK